MPHLKCSRRGRVTNAFPLGADPGLGLILGLTALSVSAWTTHTIKRTGRYRRPQIYEEVVHLKGMEHLTGPQ